jgi:two-component system response regulator FlrC
VDNGSLGEEVQNHEHKKILQTLREEMGNRKAVAEKLGISQRTLRYKLARMREKGINIPDRYGAIGY